MSKLYITYNEKKKSVEYYAYQVGKEGPIHIPLDEPTTKAYLSKVNNAKIVKIEEYPGHIEVILSDNRHVVIDSKKVWLTQDQFSDKIASLEKEIKHHQEKSQSYLKKLHQLHYTPKVKRNNKHKGKTYFVSGISICLAAVLVGNAILSEINKQESINQIPDESIALLNDSEENKISEIDILEPIPVEEDEPLLGIPVSFAYDLEDGVKYQQTIDLCSPYLERWINRYGLPRELTYALTSLEYGLLDCHKQDNGACGPMQLQVGAQHKEHYKVKVYKDGVFTGQYDEFWAADENRLNDPELEGKPIKIIQNLEDNFQIGAANYQRCIERYKNIFLATDAYNKGLYAMNKVYEKCSDKISKPLDYYKENFNDFSWTEIIPTYSKEVFNQETYGDSTYIWDVLKHLPLEERGETVISYFYEGKEIIVDLSNPKVYNNGIARG